MPYIPSDREVVARSIDEGRVNAEDSDSRRAILQLLVAKDGSATKVLSIEELGAHVDGLTTPGRYQQDLRKTRRSRSIDQKQIRNFSTA